MSEIEYLSLRDVLIAHQAAIALFGGRDGIRDQNLLESSLAQPKQAISGQDLYPGVWNKAAAYAFFLARNHPFIDGNKRTAAISMNTFLVLNGHQLKIKPGKLHGVFVDIATGKMEIEEIAKWVRRNSTSTPMKHALYL